MTNNWCNFLEIIFRRASRFASVIALNYFVRCVCVSISSGESDDGSDELAINAACYTFFHQFRFDEFNLCSVYLLAQPKHVFRSASFVVISFLCSVARCFSHLWLEKNHPNADELESKLRFDRRSNRMRFVDFFNCIFSFRSIIWNDNLLLNRIQFAFEILNRFSIWN